MKSLTAGVIVCQTLNGVKSIFTQNNLAYWCTSSEVKEKDLKQFEKIIESDVIVCKLIEKQAQSLVT